MIDFALSFRLPPPVDGSAGKGVAFPTGRAGCYGNTSVCAPGGLPFLLGSILMRNAILLIIATLCAITLHPLGFATRTATQDPACMNQRARMTFANPPKDTASTTQCGEGGPACGYWRTYYVDDYACEASTGHCCFAAVQEQYKIKFECDAQNNCTENPSTRTHMAWIGTYTTTLCQPNGTCPLPPE